MSATVTTRHRKSARWGRLAFACAFAFFALALVYATGYSNLFATRYERAAALRAATTSASATRDSAPAAIAREAYNRDMLALAHRATTTPLVLASLVSSTTPKDAALYTATTSVVVPGRAWPASAVYPDSGALLPYRRVIAYYGNFYSTQMGVLGQYPADEALARLKETARAWQDADPLTPVIPAIDYIAVTAQGTPGLDGKYRARMPDAQIAHALALAQKADGIVFLDVQVGLSDLRAELPLLAKYLALPNVHLAIDPEFSMTNGEKPGTVIGAFDAADVNYAADYLALLANEHNLPPKILVVHRFTYAMVTRYERIRPLPKVQIVMDMDGWGTPEKKYGTYNNVIATEPVQFTGFKLFYKNDLRPPSTHLLTPAEVLKLTPAPVFIQYQ